MSFRSVFRIDSDQGWNDMRDNRRMKDRHGFHWLTPLAFALQLVFGQATTRAATSDGQVSPDIETRLAASEAGADETGETMANSGNPTLLDRIEVEGHYDNAVGASDAASQGSITAKLIENRPVLRTGEILELVPGLVVTQHSGDGKANQYYLRGFNLDHGTDFATTVDGMAVNMPTHAHGQGYSDINFLIPELVSRIDYRKGPYYADEGDFSSAGAAHIALRDRLGEGIASLTLGEHNYQRVVVADSNELSRESSLLYGVETGHNDGPWINPENFRKTNALLRYSSNAENRRLSVTAMFYRADWDSTDQIPLRAVQAGQLDRFGAIDPSDGGRTARYSLSGQWLKSSRFGTTEINAYAIRSRLNLFSNFTYFLDDPVNGDQFEQAESRRVAGFAVAHMIDHALGAIPSSTKIGWQFRDDDIDPIGLYTNVDRRRLDATRVDQVSERSNGVYIENTTQWIEKFRSVAGIRYDRYRFDVDSDNALNSGKVSSGIVSPKFSMIFGPWANTELFANWGRGFHSNDARGTTIRIDPGNGDPVDPVTPLVRSEGSEIGLRSELVPGLQTSLSIWQLDLDSELLFVGDAGTTEPSRPSRRNGVELNMHYVVNRNLMLDFDFASSRARFSDNDPAGNRIPGAVDRVISAGIYVNDIGPWSGALQWRYFGPRPLIEDDSVRSKGTSLVYARVGYRFSPSWQLTADLFNLFDSKSSDIDYFHASRLRGEPADGIEDIHFHPVEPRSVRLTLSSRF
jgi:outer membrane cobalamin receptor